MAHPLKPAEVPQVPTVSAQEANELVLGEKKAPYLDVRTPQEFARGHVAGSVNVPYLLFKEDGSAEVNKNFLDEAQKALPDSDTEIVVSCQAGRRGALATRELLGANYSKVFNMAGGLNAWRDAGFPTEQ